MNYIGALERYHEYKTAINDLLASLVTGIVDPVLFSDREELIRAIYFLQQNYPFVNLAYTLDNDGIQTSENISKQRTRHASVKNKQSYYGIDRSHRPYFLLAKNQESAIVTEPYLSNDSHNLCISAAMRCHSPDNKTAGYIVVDVDLVDVISYLMGDIRRQQFHPFFALVYSLVVAGLFFVVGILLFSAATEMAKLLSLESHQNLYLGSFGIIIFLTLALAVFDLGKTTLEEEILLRKDIFRHSSTRRTITRFVAAILIAVSIEALLLMFKSVLGNAEYLLHAVAMMAAAIGLLIGLGIYVYLGAKAEAILKTGRPSP